MSVLPRASFHVIDTDSSGVVKDIQHITKTGARINGGFFVFRREVFDFMKDGEELVEAPFQRLINKEQLITYEHDGFWACMDTFKEKQELDDIYSRGAAPWEVWTKDR